MEEIVDRFDKKKREQEVRLFKEIQKSYKTVERSLTDEAERILSDIPEGTTRNLQHRRIITLLNQVERELTQFTKQSLIPMVADGMVQSSYLGEEQSLSILRSVTPETLVLSVLPTRSLEAFTKHLTTGPLGELFNSFGPEAAEKARRDMLVGLTLGENPRKLATRLQRSLGTSLTRSFLIARTETMRAHREGNRQSYKQNPNVVTGWIWHASASRRTCAACWAMHGTEHDLEEEMNAHPACRCTMVPKTKTWREMGYDIDESAPPVPKGEDLFAQQSEETQRAVLGSQYDRYKNGDVTLQDFVAIKPSRYGNTITKKVPT